MNRLLLFFIIFLLLGAFFIISNRNLHISKENDRKELGKLYYAWLSGLFENAKHVTGYAVEYKWLPDKTGNLTR